jgi:hypothetical protein
MAKGIVEETSKLGRWLVKDFIASRAAARLGIDNSLPRECLANMLAVAVALRKVEDALLREAVITSGYRCPELNKAVGGSERSEHLMGRAVDVYFPGMPHLIAAQRAAILHGSFWTVELRGDGLHLGLGVPNRLLLLRQRVKGGAIRPVASFL